MKHDTIVVHYAELWLKGRNRHSFVNRLKENIRIALKGCNVKIVDNRDRLLLHFKDEKSTNTALERLAYVPGISWFGSVFLSKTTIDSIIKTASKMLDKDDTVRIVARRSYKDTKFNSYDIVSAFIKKSKGLKFKIDRDAKKELLINVTKEGTLMSSEKIKGVGGLPVGSSGRAVSLLSGGIDSPVSSFYAMKRGLDVVYLHMHAFNNNKQAESSKMREIVKLLSRYSPNSVVYYAPAYIFQSATIKIPQKYELVLFRRFLYKLAEEIAKKERATAIVTGESLGQVASQTLGNMTASQQGVEPIIIRPLVGFDKQEIIERAKHLGTYDTSIKSYKDVCSIGVSSPSTNMNERLVSRLYKSCKLDLALKRTLKLTSDVRVNAF